MMGAVRGAGAGIRRKQGEVEPSKYERQAEERKEQQTLDQRRAEGGYAEEDDEEVQPFFDDDKHERGSDSSDSIKTENSFSRRPKKLNFFQQIIYAIKGGVMDEYKSS